MWTSQDANEASNLCEWITLVTLTTHSIHIQTPITGYDTILGIVQILLGLLDMGIYDNFLTLLKCGL